MRGRRSPRPFDLALPLLRRRTTWLLPQLELKARAFVRLMPLLLTARFRRPGFDAEPPGVRLPSRRRRWGVLCQALELPPPSSIGAPATWVQSVVLAPGLDGRFQVLVLLADGVPPSELPRVLNRMKAITELAEKQCPGLEVRLGSRAELHPALMTWAAVCAGEVPPMADGPLDRLELISRAPTRTARCLALLMGEHRHPLEVVREGHAPSSPEAFAAHCSTDPIAAASLHCDLGTLDDVRTIGRTLRSACIAALRRAPIADRSSLRVLLREELFTSSLPGVFRLSLEKLTARRKPIERRTSSGWALAVDGLELARGESLDHLRAAAVAQSPLLAPPEAPWPRVAQLLHQTPRRNLVMVETAPTRHLVIGFSRSGRPHARRVDAEGLLRFALRSRVNGVACEVVASLGSEQGLVTRIAQIASLSTSGPVAIEVGQRVLMAEAHRIRSLPLSTAFARPRRITWLPSDPELAHSLRRPTGTTLPTVHATAWPLGDHGASIIFLDSQGEVFRDEVDRRDLESWLVESRDLLRAGAPPTLMSVTVHPALAALAGRKMDSSTQVLPLDVECHPDATLVWLDGEVFCGPRMLSWTALAEAVLSHWPPGTSGRVGVRRISFVDGLEPRSPLELLAVRSRVVRRLRVGLGRLNGVLAA
jgi:hypothetical protein